MGSGGQMPATTPWTGGGGGQMPVTAPWTGGGGIDQPPGLRQHPFSVMNRNWGDNRRLDLVAQPEGYLVWHDRALGHLAKDRMDVRKLLLWAERQTKSIGPDEEAEGAREAGLEESVGLVSFALYEGVKHIIADTLLPRARACGDGRGLELWRKLHVEWEGAAPQVVASKASRFQDPTRCSTEMKLWEELPKWEQLGAEVVSGGYPMPDWVKASALNKLVPTSMLQVIMGRPAELSEFTPKLAWVKAQLEYAKGAARAQQFQAEKSPKDTSKDVDMGNLGKTGTGAQGGGEDAFLANLQAACLERARAGDVQGMNAITGALFAFSKGGKGKGWGGKGSPGGYKGGYKGGPPPLQPQHVGGQGDGGKGGGGGGKGGKGGGYQGGGKGGNGSSQFPGTCNHCGKWGHKKQHCKALDNEMEKYRKGLHNAEGEDAAVPEEGGGQGEGGQDGMDWDQPANWWMGATFNLTKEPIRQSQGMFGPLAADDEEEEEEDAKAAHICGLCGDDPTGCQPNPGPGNWQVSRSLRRKMRRRPKQLAILAREDEPDIEEDPKEVNALGKPSEGARLVEAVVDSGAADPVVPPDLFPGKVKPSAMSRTGRRYTGPDGSRIPNLGEMDAMFDVDEGYRCGLRVQVANVQRPLISVTYLTKAGNKVVLGENGGEIINEKTGRKVKIQRKGGVYVLRMWVPRAAEGKKASGFPRPGMA